MPCGEFPVLFSLAVLCTSPSVIAEDHRIGFPCWIDFPASRDLSKLPCCRLLGRDRSSTWSSLLES